VYLVERPEFSVEIPSDDSPKVILLILRKRDNRARFAGRLNPLTESSGLRAFARSVDSLKSDQHNFIP
jgi:hypothetical protein